MSDNSHNPPAQDAETYARPTDDEILQYERKIKEPHTLAPLVGEKTGFESLQAEYADGSPTTQAKIALLAEEYSGLRCTRRDGNCFYRGLAYRLCELVSERKDTLWAKAVMQRLGPHSREAVGRAGYDLDLMGDFAECWEDAVRDGDREGAAADSVVCWLRIVTAAILKNNRDMFEAFILDSYPTLDLFIGSQVEPMNIEADQPHIVAIANALGVTIKIGNLDTTLNTDGVMNWHEIEPLEPLVIPDSAPKAEDQPQVVLLYRPGHYDILYPI
ncbi:hypothetical protein PhCBS80983_g02428 [Powellomyces hirtus]|uniref:ubiquitinyl hydrolase 1 n=1 Tax=Powellomyces hirtus TaxID=109895 RepID=A0A507E6M0_9FUNG|nr:hypothetical protein PhCBS80983_g02428 [Powellomyces hirtus]